MLDKVRANVYRKFETTLLNIGHPNFSHVSFKISNFLDITLLFF
jgi:hypothetical protein